MDLVSFPSFVAFSVLLSLSHFCFVYYTNLGRLLALTLCFCCLRRVLCVLNIPKSLSSLCSYNVSCYFLIMSIFFVVPAIFRPSLYFICYVHDILNIFIVSTLSFFCQDYPYGLLSLKEISLGFNEIIYTHVRFLLYHAHTHERTIYQSYYARKYPSYTLSS